MPDNSNRLRQIDHRLDLLEVQINAFRSMLMVLLAYADQEEPGTSERALNIAAAVMKRRDMANFGLLEAALDALIEDVQNLRDLPAND